MFINRLLTTIVLISLWLSTAGFAPISVNPLPPQAAFVVPAAPESFNKTEPNNNAIDILTVVTLKWTASTTSGAVYEYCVATKVQCPPGKWKSTGASTSVTVKLQAATTYYWQVRSHTGDRVYTYANNGQTWKFNTITAAPATFTKSSPANNATEQPLNITVSWTASTGVNITYAVCYDTIDNNTCDTAWSQPISGTSTTLVGLTPFTPYYWQVRASNASGTSYADNNTWWTFRTQIAQPGAFGKVSPSNTTTNLPYDIYLSWSASSGTDITYSYCLVKGLGNNSYCDLLNQWVPVSTAMSVALVGLDPGQNYSWQVRASNSSGTTDANNGAWWTFSTLPSLPANFQKINPQNGVDHIGLAPYLYWTTSNGTGLTYEYCLKVYVLNQGCQNGNYVSVGIDTYVAVQTALARNTEYIWQVRARDSGGQLQYADGGEQADWHFTTLPPVPVVDESKAVFQVVEDQTLNGSLSPTSTSGLPLTFDVFGPDPAGKEFLLDTDGDFIFIPNADFNGVLTFKYTVSDGVNPPTGPHTATITVTSANDKPVFRGEFEQVKAYNFTYPLDSDIYLTFETSDADLPYDLNETLTITNGVLPPGATLVALTDPISKVTSADFSWLAAPWSTAHPDPYEFTVRVTDSQGLYSELTIIITIEPIRLFASLINR